MKLVILDRDGVINQDSDAHIKSPREWKPIPGSLEAIARLTQAGHHVVVATNQSGIGRGLFDMATLNAIHDKMHKACALVGAQPILVLTGKGAKTQREGGLPAGTKVHADLAAAVKSLIK